MKRELTKEQKETNRIPNAGEKAQAYGVMKAALDYSPIPAAVQQRLERTYAALDKIPQEAPPRRSRFGHRMTIAGLVAAACLMFTGAAFAASNIFQIGSGDASSFYEGKELPVFSSMKEDAHILSADVGQIVSIDALDVTLDAVSCDRSVINLYLTLTSTDGFDLDAMTLYEGSQESQWSRLQQALPLFSYTLVGSDGVTNSGDVRRLDAYLEEGAIKCLMRIIPRSSMAEQVQLTVDAWTQDGTEPAFSIGLDMADVPAPQQIGPQDLSFETSQGQKVLPLERFTVSELATVLVARNATEQWTDDDGSDVIGYPASTLSPAHVKITDSKGNILVGVDAGDGQGMSDEEPIIMEFAGMDHSAQSVTFTPMLMNGSEGSAPEDPITLDVTQTGAKIPLTEFGGYELAQWTVEDSTVEFTLKPYGWVPIGEVPELLTDQGVPLLSDEWVDAETGQTEVGYHSAIAYNKWDYSTGEVLQMHSYYKATEQALRAIHDYYCFVSPAGTYSEDAISAKTLNF